MISAIHDSPVGPLTIHSDGAAITGLEFDTPRYQLTPSPRGSDKLIAQAQRELDAYFAGKLKVFGVPVRGRGTPFQQKVWAALTQIPYGVTRTYGQQAAAIGAPKAVRAVGLANGRNPISIIVPCHRVIGASGALTGFGGGLERKKYLLDLEQGALSLSC